jgi:Protein of unknown function (DUF3396)
MSWQNDPIFGGPSKSRLGKYSAPSFRLSLISTWPLLDPTVHVEAMQALFDLFQPILARHCTRIVIQKRAGMSQSKRAIQPSDWKPFELFASVPKVGSGDFMFQGGVNGDEYGSFRGPALARFVYSSCVYLDFHIPVEEFGSGGLDIAALQSVLGKIPWSSMVAGYGMTLSEHFSSGFDEERDALAPVALKYLTVDIQHPYGRNWRGDWEDPNSYWLSGIDWLTGIGEPFLSRFGGADAIIAKLPGGVTAKRSDKNLILQLGPRPTAGGPDEPLSALQPYFAVANLLAPTLDGYPSTKHRVDNPFANHYDQKKDPRGLEWARRFIDGPQSAWMKRAGRA